MYTYVDKIEVTYLKCVEVLCILRASIMMITESVFWLCVKRLFSDPRLAF